MYWANPSVKQAWDFPLSSVSWKELLMGHRCELLEKSWCDRAGAIGVWAISSCNMWFWRPSGPVGSILEYTMSTSFSSSHVWMWELDCGESWALKNLCFELWCWRRLLRVPWTARRSNQSILKISPGCLLEGLMLKLKLQYFGHLMRRTDSFKKDPDAGKDWGWEEKATIEDEMVGWHHRLNGRRGWDGWMASPTQWTWVWVDSGSWWWAGGPGVLRLMGSQRVGHDWSWNWVELNQNEGPLSLQCLSSDLYW